MQNFSFEDINKFVYLNQIIDKDYFNEIVLDNFVIRKDKLIEKLKNINYSSFDNITTKEDIKNIRVNNLVNFIIDNRYGALEIVSKKNKTNLSKIQWTKLIKIRNIKKWFNYFFIVSVMTKILASQGNKDNHYLED
jgi:hypothetical protein